MKNLCFTFDGAMGQYGERNAGPKLAPAAFFQSSSQ